MLKKSVENGCSTRLQKTKIFKNIFYVVCFATMLFLNGCTTMKKDTDAANNPNTTSKYKHLSQNSYKVLGKSYETLASSKNYHEQGIASWYGLKFHRLRTSSGERYNMLAMTAAHKSLPLQTYVQVTNLTNNRQVIVKVNDRGPFEADRLIDLSYGAAKKLGIVGHGTALVDVKAIDKTSETTKAYLAQNTMSDMKLRNKVYLQVGDFQKFAYAEKLKQRIHTIVASPVKVTRVVKSSNHLFHVKIGPFKDFAAANQLSEKLKAIGISSKKTLT